MLSKKIDLFGYIAIYLFFLIPSVLSAVESDDVLLKWEDVPGSLGYVLEIRSVSNSILLSKKISTTSYELSDFEPGVYEHRVGVINKFGKIEAYTDWVKFQVVKTKVPIIDNKTVYSAGKEESRKRIQIKGKNFLPSIKVYLSKDGKKIPANSVDVKNETLLIADFNLAEIDDVGMYDLVLENPKRKTAVSPRNFVLGRNPEQAEKIANRQAKINNNEIPPDYYDTPYWSTMWRSAIVPGWGQDYIDEASWKMYLYPVLILGSAGAYAKGYQDFLSARKDYYNSVQMGFVLTTLNDSESIFLFNNLQSTNKYNSAKTRLNQVQIGAGLVAAFAIYNIVDAYLSVRKNVVIESNDGLNLLDSKWKVNAISNIRTTSNWEPYHLERYSGLEFTSRF